MFLNLRLYIQDKKTGNEIDKEIMKLSWDGNPLADMKPGKHYSAKRLKDLYQWLLKKSSAPADELKKIYPWESKPISELRTEVKEDLEQVEGAMFTATFFADKYQCTICGG